MKIQKRIDNPNIIDFPLIKKELENQKHVIIQFSKEIYTDEMLYQINELCKILTDDFGVRFYGHYTEVFDFNVLEKIPDVKCLYVDCLFKVKNVEQLSKLKYLSKLNFGVFELKDLEFLSMKNLINLVELTLSESRSKALNLSYLKEYKNLKSLRLGNHMKNIEVLGELHNLEFLSLNSIKKVNVDFVNKLKKLKQLHFILGSRENIWEISENEIEELEITWVRGFNNINNLSRFKNLKKLIIQDNIQLEKIHFEKLIKLEEVKILNCKSMNSLTGLENLSSLKKLTIYKTDLKFENIVQNLPKSLNYFGFYTSKTKIDSEIKKQIIAKGYNTT
jgi:hypothetical protein